ncbi:hypothetical protein T492DRAFT_1107369 [Pavlovales sp. CCMP2436]|nr:hypothetical protein T492DRAFT_1107369 [Pavlovales sp. CCMP2436]
MDLWGNDFRVVLQAGTAGAHRRQIRRMDPWGTDRHVVLRAGAARAHAGARQDLDEHVSGGGLLGPREWGGGMAITRRQVCGRGQRRALVGDGLHGRDRACSRPYPVGAGLHGRCQAAGHVQGAGPGTDFVHGDLGGRAVAARTEERGCAEPEDEDGEREAEGNAVCHVAPRRDIAGCDFLRFQANGGSATVPACIGSVLDCNSHQRRRRRWRRGRGRWWRARGQIRRAWRRRRLGRRAGRRAGRRTWRRRS